MFSGTSASVVGGLTLTDASSRPEDATTLPGFDEVRTARADSLMRYGLDESTASLMAWAESPWLDTGRLSAGIWRAVEQERQGYLSDPRLRDVPKVVAQEALVRYSGIARRVGAVHWVAALDRVLVEEGSRPDVEPASTSEFVPNGGNILRLVRLQQQVAEGVQLPEAAARAFLRIPWLDDAPVPVGLVQHLQRMAATAESQDLMEALLSAREAAVDHNAVEYVVATDLLLNGLKYGMGLSEPTDVEGPEPSEDEEPTESETEGSSGDPLSGLEAFDGWSEEVSWLKDLTGEAEPGLIAPALSLQPGKRVPSVPAPAVDYGTKVPAALFRSGSGLLERAAAAAYVAAGAQTLEDVVSVLADLDLPSLKGAMANVPASTLLPSLLSSFQPDALLDEVAAGWKPRSLRILNERVLADDPCTLEELGLHLGVTRERVRQIARKVEDALLLRFGPAISEYGRLLKDVVPSALPADEFEAAVLRCVPGDGPASRWVRKQAVATSGFRVDSGYAVQPHVHALRKKFERECDHLTDEYGFIAVDEMDVRSTLDEGVFRYLASAAGLQELFGFWMKGSSMRNRTVAALASIGRPATSEEVADVAGLQGNRAVPNFLSAEPFIVRATRNTWAFKEWVESAYGGIAEEIVRCIERDGGETDVAGLLTEIPERFDVTESSVRSYLATSRFVVEDGKARLATSHRRNWRSLHQLDRVTVLPDGTPVLQVPVEERYLHGYSIKVPHAFAERLGLDIDESRMVPVLEPAGHPDVSAIWRAHDPSGPELGRVRAHLAELEVAAGDDIYIEAREDGIAFRTAPPAAGGLRGVNNTSAAHRDSRSDGEPSLLSSLRERRRL